MISLNQLKKTRSSVAALSTLIALQSLYAQSADAQVTFSSTVVSTTCALSFNAGVGATSATVTMANISDLPPFAIPLISWKSGLRLI